MSVDSIPPPSLTTMSLGTEFGISMYAQEPTTFSVPIIICFATVTVSFIYGWKNDVLITPGPMFSLKLYDSNVVFNRPVASV